MATNPPTHTQLVTENEAALSPPEARAMSTVINRLLDDPAKRQWLAQNARRLIRQEHTMEYFCKDVDKVFGELETHVAGGSEVV